MTTPNKTKEKPFKRFREILKEDRFVYDGYKYALSQTKFYFKVLEDFNKFDSNYEFYKSEYDFYYKIVMDYRKMAYIKLKQSNHATKK